ncbi:DUF2946 family protein [Silvimonas amylolytica]|uniref:DUF2946 domain-containing protein n=1 Tax=Silvimonas amylolytica TaxID=449663 RepID=A0ABQ2PQX3_9NEIS|nr:DUF2946 family protein [Silvimonas amylolytica]GGP27382.1 hypothetical protein GCM10010971_32010 [Silvimonas amylolytica]
MYWSLRYFRFALIAALMAMLAAALVPPVMQMLNPVAISLTASHQQDEMSDCGMPGMSRAHRADTTTGATQSCPLCSLFCHIPALPGLPQLALLAPINAWLVLLQQQLADWPAPAFVIPPARAPPATRF